MFLYKKKLNLLVYEQVGDYYLNKILNSTESRAIIIYFVFVYVLFLNLLEE